MYDFYGVTGLCGAGNNICNHGAGCIHILQDPQYARFDCRWKLRPGGSGLRSDVQQGTFAIRYIDSVYSGMRGRMCDSTSSYKTQNPSAAVGILTMLALYSVNLRVMGGRANIPLLNKATVFSILGGTSAGDYDKLIISFALLLIVLVLLFLFLKTKIGFALRATGDNVQ